MFARRLTNTTFDGLLTELKRSNEIAGELRDQIVAELRAGRAVLEAPTPSRDWIDVLLVHPLKWLGDKSGSAIVAALAVEALRWLMQLLSSGPTIPN